jgi:hypothetical protein
MRVAFGCSVLWCDAPADGFWSLEFGSRGVPLTVSATLCARHGLALERLRLVELLAMRAFSLLAPGRNVERARPDPERTD